MVRHCTTNIKKPLSHVIKFTLNDYGGSDISFDGINIVNLTKSPGSGCSKRDQANPGLARILTWVL